MFICASCMRNEIYAERADDMIYMFCLHWIGMNTVYSFDGVRTEYVVDG